MINIGQMLIGCAMAKREHGINLNKLNSNCIIQVIAEDNFSDKMYSLSSFTLTKGNRKKVES